MSEKYEFIDAEYATMAAEGDAPVVMQMCEWLGVSKSGFYDWRTRPQSEAAQRRELLEIKIRALFEANNSEYGYRRIHAALVRGGESVDDETVRKIMRDLGLEPCQPKPWRFSLTEQDGQAGPIPDLVNRDFTASKPGEKMVGDITYIDTWEGWVYLATVIDCATRKIVGWAMGDNYKTPLISSAIEMAARNLDLPEGAIFHSDRRAISRSLPGVMRLRLAVARQGSPMRGGAGHCSLINFPSHFRITRRWPSLFRNDGCFHAINNPERRPSGVILSFRLRPVKSGRLRCRE